MLPLILYIAIPLFTMSMFEYYIGYFFYILGGILSYISLPISFINNYIYPVGSFVYDVYFYGILVFFALFIVKIVMKIKSHD